MPGKGLSIHFFSSHKTISSPSSSSSFSSPRTPTTPASPAFSHTFSESMVHENIENASTMIRKWDLNSPSITKLISLFLHNRKEAKEFLKCVKDLCRAMHYLFSEHAASDKLVLAQTLMQTAMKRLEHEFYQILSSCRDELDPESISSGQFSDWSSYVGDDDDHEVGDENEDELKRTSETLTEMERVSQLAKVDLKAIADVMIGSGYGKECVKIYKVIRKSIVHEGLYQLGIENFKASHVQKMHWEALEHMNKNWLTAVKIAVKTLFSGEKFLCDHVFSASNVIRESCFCDITIEEALNLFKFPEFVAKSKKSPERIFQLMELHGVLHVLFPEIELIFNSEATSAVKLQALSSMHKLGDSVRAIISDFESTVHKDSSKTLAVGGGIHPLTRSAMSYISSLGEYSNILANIVVDHQPPSSSTFPESYFGSSASPTSPGSAVSLHLAWLILVLLCKLDHKAQLYKDVALSYLFLANNLQFIIEKVRTSLLKDLLGDEWLCTHDKKLKQYALNYETMAWNKVFSSLPDKSSLALTPEVAKECFRRFNAAFEEAYMKQTLWIVQNRKLRDEMKVSIAKNLVPAYREFYDNCLVMLSGESNLEVLVRFGPDDLENYLSDLFHGFSILGSFSSSSSPSSPKGRISH